MSEQTQNTTPAVVEEEEPEVSYTCHCCGTDYHVDTPMADPAGQDECGAYLCTRCTSAYYTYSEVQDCFIHDRDAVQLQDTEDWVSRGYARENCYHHSYEYYADEDNIPQNVLDYGTDVLEECGISSADIGRKLVYGVELEMEPADEDDDNQEAIVRACGGVKGPNHICKSDGSLADGGVELVTIPGSLEWHKKDFGWPARLERCRNEARSGKGTNQCGMHVHINRAALSLLQQGKLLVFINSERTRSLIELVAQRPAANYCCAIEKKVTHAKFHVNYEGDRYQAVNVSAQTMEIRIFRGNLRTERVFKNLEFVDAVVNYVGSCSLPDAENPAAFTNWLLKNRGTYPHLVAFLQERQWSGMPAPKLRPDKGTVALSDV